MNFKTGTLENKGLVACLSLNFAGEVPRQDTG
jgi:hypothetical protein